MERTHPADCNNNHGTVESRTTALESQTTRSRWRRGSSCQALRHAVLKLHRLDDFSMCRIGSGFFSEVFKVTHKTSGELMVLKMNTSEDNRPNTLKEVQLMNKLSHPNILRFLGVCVHEGQLHALTEYMNSGNLHELLCDDKDSKVLWFDRLKIASDVASGMEYLHSRGSFHRDLTSRNILIENLDTNGASKRAVVADFGLATAIPDPRRPFHLSVVGSPYWIAPECIIGQPYNETADVFSFGITLCETIARIDADPDILPRTQTFGLDYIAYSELLDDCPLHFLYLAFHCCQMEPRKRPTFAELYKRLCEIRQDLTLEETALSFSPVGEYSAQRLMQHRLSSSNQRSCSEQSLDFLRMDESDCMSATARVIGKHMTKEDPLYEPAPANTNPFASNAQLSTGRKLVASETERQQMFELSMTLPVSNPKAATQEMAGSSKVERKQSVTKQSLSLPESHGIVQRAIAQFDAQIASSHNYRNPSISPMEKLFSSSDYASGDSSIDGSMNSQDFMRHSSKQRNLECAMLFCGLDLIQMHRATSSELSDTHPSTDLESEFQDDLEDVLRQSKWDSEDASLSPTHDSVFAGPEAEWWLLAEQSDPSACRYLHPVEISTRYLHPTLVEKRKQLRRVESKQKEKLEQLQLKLDQLRVTAKRNSGKSRKKMNSVP